MTPTEILTEFAHYYAGGMKDEMTTVALMDHKSGAEARPGVTYQEITKVPISPRDMKLYFRSGMNCGLVDFSHKPADFRDKYYEDSFDVKFPFPDGLYPEGGKIRLPTWIRLDIRAGRLNCSMAIGILEYLFAPLPNPTNLSTYTVSTTYVRYTIYIKAIASGSRQVESCPLRTANVLIRSAAPPTTKLFRC